MYLHCAIEMRSRTVMWSNAVVILYSAGRTWSALTHSRLLRLDRDNDNTKNCDARRLAVCARVVVVGMTEL